MKKPDIEKIKANRKKIIPIVVILVLLIIGWYAFGNVLFQSGKITATGTIEAKTVKITASIPGEIADIFYNEGDKVKINDVISNIKRDDLVAARDQNAAALSKARLGYSQVSSAGNLATLNAAQASANAAQETFKKAEADYNRIKSLYNQGASSLSELERYETAYKVSSENYNSALGNLNNLRSSGGVKAQIGLASTDIDRAVAALMGSNSQLEQLVLKSPIDGIVILKNYEKGEYVGTGMSVATIADLENLWIKVYVTTEELPKIKLGQEVKFTVSGYNEEFTGKISFISDKGEYTPKTILTVNERANVVFGVKIATTSQGGVLKPGMPADVVFN
ncbi:MAG: efflux RND transporter periplasmic adaptor subunit [Eubacteriales bacterium]